MPPHLALQRCHTTGKESLALLGDLNTLLDSGPRLFSPCHLNYAAINFPKHIPEELGRKLQQVGSRPWRNHTEASYRGSIHCGTPRITLKCHPPHQRYFRTYFLDRKKAPTLSSPAILFFLRTLFENRTSLFCLVCLEFPGFKQASYPSLLNSWEWVQTQPNPRKAFSPVDKDLHHR